MPDLTAIIGKAPELIIFIGMLAVVWRSLSIAHDLAKTVLQGGMKLPAGMPIAVAPIVPHPTPITATADTTVVDPGLIAFIKKQEGFTAKAQWDYKQYTNGYGTKANAADEVVDEQEAERRLIVEINAAERLVEKVAANAPKGVKQALTDLTYNAGPGWESQDLGKLILAGNYEEAKSHILQYNHAGGKVLAGLTARREAEVSWFDKPL